MDRGDIIEETQREKSSEIVESTTFARTLLQFFVVPALVVAGCVGLFLFFTWMVAEEESSADYLREIQTGSATRRWQAAFELAKRMGDPDEQESLRALVPRMVDLFERSKEDDPRVRRYLALALGHLGEREAVPSLLEALGDDDPETQIYAMWALGTMGDERAIEPLIEMAQREDPGMRKMAVYSLGALGAEQARPVLRAALDDFHPDVAWNAAISLAQIGDDAGLGRIEQMLDRGYLDTMEEMTPEQRAEVMVTAMQGVVLLGDGAMRERLEEISREDPHLKVRQAAFEALRSLDKQRED